METPRCDRRDIDHDFPNTAAAQPRVACRWRRRRDHDRAVGQDDRAVRRHRAAGTLVDAVRLRLDGHGDRHRGVAEILRDFGLSAAAVQAKHVSREQRDNLFWINSGIGLMLSVVVFATAHWIADFITSPHW